MMQKVAKLNSARPGPAKQAPKEPTPRPFVAIGLPYNPWALCTNESSDITYITCGLIWKIAQILTSSLNKDQRNWIIHGRHRWRFPDGRHMKISFRNMHEGSNEYPIGGYIQLWNSKGHYAAIQDVRSFFQLNYTKLARRYGVEHLPQEKGLETIMERTRDSLHQVGIKPPANGWWLCSSVSDYLWRELDMDVWSVPTMGPIQKGPGNLQGYHVFGRTDQPVYAYDINSAYLSVMAEFPTLQPFTDRMWGARRELAQAHDPAAHVLKLAATILPGKMTSRLPGNRLYRPTLGNYIRQRTNNRLSRAMNAANLIEEGPNDYNVYRYCVDGFLARTNIEHLMPIGTDLGQWKPIKKHNHLSIAQTNVWYTDTEYKDAGLAITEPEIINGSKDPYIIHTTRTIFDWELLEERVVPWTIRQGHNWMACRKCWEEDPSIELHDLCGGIYIP